MVLSGGQTLLVYLVMMGAFGIAFSAFLFEMFYYHVKK